MNLYLIRHGQSEGNVSGIKGLDPPMTGLGHQQIQRTAEVLHKIGMTHLYCSPLIRAMQTAQTFREQLHLEPIVNPVFCETWGTDWNARKKEELQRVFPWATLPDALNTLWWPQIAETSREIMQRAKNALELLRQKHWGTSHRICLVSHIMFGSSLINEILEIPTHTDIFFQLRNASCTHIVLEEDHRRVVQSLNDVHHLPPHLWT